MYIHEHTCPYAHTPIRTHTSPFMILTYFVIHPKLTNCQDFLNEQFALSGMVMSPQKEVHQYHIPKLFHLETVVAHIHSF